MQILSDGTVQITNRKTGETKVVQPNELGNYGPGLQQKYLLLKNQSATPSATPTQPGIQYAPEQTQEQHRYKRWEKYRDSVTDITQKTKVQDYMDKIASSWKTTRGYELFGEPTDKALQRRITKAETGPKKITIPGPLEGFPIIGGVGKHEEWQILDPQTGQTKTLKNYQEAVNELNNSLSALGQKTLPEDQAKTEEQKQPGVIAAVYNLAFRPMVEGAKGYGELWGTAAGSVYSSLLTSNLGKDDMRNFAKSRALIAQAQKETDPVKKDALFRQSRELDQRNDNAHHINDLLIQIMEPKIRAEYRDAVSTVINGSLATLGAMGAVGQASFGLTGGIPKLILMNLAFNAGLYGTGEALKAEREQVGVGKQIGGFIKGATGFSTTGPVSGLFGDSERTRMADMIISLGAPVLFGKVREAMEGKTPTSPEMQKGIVPTIRGSLFRSIAVVDPEDQIKSERLTREALQQTTGRTKRSMGIDLQRNVENAGTFIDDMVKKSSARTGPLSGNDVMSRVEEYLHQTPEGATNETGIKFVMDELRRKIKSGEPSPDIERRAEDFGTNDFSINEGRKYLNSQSSEWFDKGGGSVSESDKINQLRWIASNALKDQLAEGSPLLKNALNIQHTSLAYRGALSREAQRAGMTAGFGLYRYFNSFVRAIISPFQVPVARAFAGKASPETRSILRGTASTGEAPPAVRSVTGAFMNPRTPGAPPTLSESEIASQPTTARGTPEPGRTIFNPTEKANIVELPSLQKGKRFVGGSNVQQAIRMIAQGATSEEDLVSRIQEYAKKFGETATDAQLKELRAGINRELTAITGGTGTYKKDYATRVIMRDDPQIGKVITAFEDLIDSIDKRLGKKES